MGKRKLSRLMLKRFKIDTFGQKSTIIYPNLPNLIPINDVFERLTLCYIKPEKNTQKGPPRSTQNALKQGRQKRLTWAGHVSH